MYYYYESKSIDKLAEQFLNLLAQKKPSDPFKKNWIIVQNREMQEWLTLKEAEVNSISANNQFIFPSEFIWKIYRMKFPDFPAVLPTDRTPLTWSLFELLNSDKQGSTDLRIDYPDDEMQQLQLCKAIADVFDQYQVYRPDMLSNWENQKTFTSDDSEKWQKSLWNLLIKSGKNSGSTLSRPQVFFELITLLNSGDFPVQKLPENLWIFSLPHVSQPFSQVTSMLSQSIDVFHFSSTEIKLSNSESAFSSKLLKAANNNKKVVLNSVTNDQFKEEKIREENDSTSYLGALKKIITGTDLRKIEATDLRDNFSVNSCHNPRREVEVLKDTLLSRLNSQPNLKPEDCLILVPDINKYSTIITEVLESEALGSAIPVSKTFKKDIEYSSQTLIQLLRLLKSEFKITEVLDLLENPLISKKLEISGEDFSIIREWIVELHVHRGLTGSMFSLFNGIDRLFAGYAMEPETYNSFANKSVYEKIFTSENLTLIAKLSTFTSQLQNYSGLLSGMYPVKKWLNNVEFLVEQFFSKKEEGISGLIALLNTLIDQIEVADLKRKVSFSVFYSWLKGEIQNQSSTTSGFGHGVSLSEYVPNRNIPYQFVGILGLDEGVLPSVKTRPEFDLIEKYPKQGDRIDRWEQHYLFYDMIQAARDFLHISYTGFDQHSETRKDPSVLLQQLLYEAKNKGLEIPVIEHKLHGFDPFYFDENEPKSYSAYHRQIAELNKKDSIKHGVIDSKLTKAEDDRSVIYLKDLISFYSDPAKYICANWLSVRNFESDLEPDSREFFKLEGLDKYTLKDFLAEAFLNDISLNELNTITRIRNLIPEGFPGDESYFENKSLILQLEKLKSEHNIGIRSSIDTEVEYENYTLSGTVDKIFGTDRIQLRLGDLKAKNLIEFWINHLAVLSQGHFSSYIYYFKGNKSLQKIALEADSEYYQEELSVLSDWFMNDYKEGALSFYPPETSKEFAEKILNGDDVNTAIEKALKKWDNKSEFVISENQNFYNDKIYPDEGFLYTKEFQNRAIQFWEPILKASGIVK